MEWNRSASADLELRKLASSLETAEVLVGKNALALEESAFARSQGDPSLKASGSQLVGTLPEWAHPANLGIFVQMFKWPNIQEKNWSKKLIA